PNIPLKFKIFDSCDIVASTLRDSSRKLIALFERKSAMSDTWARQNAEAVFAERRDVNKNVSLQTGEEFSMEFLKDQTPIISGKTHNDTHRFRDLYYQNQPLGYDGNARFHELRRIESECPSDAYDFGRDPRASSIRVENGGYMPRFNACHGEKEVVARKAFGEINSNQGCVTGRPQSNYTGGDFDRFGKVKFLCSFGGRIMPRSTDEKLKYVGGETHIVSIRKNLSWEELKKKTSAICKHLHSIKYQLPGDELDSLISVSSDEDLQNMIEEYNGLERLEGSQRPRLFLIPIVVDPENKTLQTLASDTSYHVNHLDHNPSFSKRLPGQMLRLDTTAMRPNQHFNGVHYNLSSYPSPPLSPSPFQHRDSNGGYSQFHGNNSSSESNHSANCQTYKQEAENLYGVQFQSGFSKNLETLPNISLVDTVCFHHERPANNGRLHSDKPCVPEESKVSFSGSTNSNDSFLGIPHSYSDSTLEINGGHSSYFSQERQSPSSPLNFTKKETQEKPVQVYRNNDLTDRRTQSNILDLKSNEEGDKTLQRDVSAAGNHYDEMYLNQETKNQERNSDTIFHLGADMECKNLPTYGNQTSTVVVDPWKQIKQDNDRLIGGTVSGNLISLEEGIAADTTNEETLDALYHTGNNGKGVVQKSFDLLQEPMNHAVQERNLEVSGIFLNNREGSNEDFLFNISSESANRQNFHETGGLELNPTLKKVSFSKKKNHVSKFILSSYDIPTVITDLQRTQIEDGLGHVRIPSIDMNKPASETYPSVERQDSPQASPHAKMNSSDTVFLSEEGTEANVDEKENSFNDTLIVEMEASVYGLQIIKNADLEDLTELGSGTYGTVYHGKWRGTDVAIKRIRKSCFAGRSSEQDRLTKDFWREAQILSNLHHPNVVAFYGIVPDGTGGTLATVTEFMVNGSLRHALLKRDRLLDDRKKIIIAMDAAFGMEYLHSKNIVHFDLKCENLLVNLRDPQRPICKVGDLGLSRIKRNTLVSGGVRGTLPWMAPELLNGSSTRVSEKVDVFSYGISLWEILTGEEPYADMHCGAIIGGIVKNTLRPPIPKTCSPDWRKLMEQCWSIDPDSRPPFTEITSRLRSMSMELVTKSKKRENKT
ncbi:unnamed protein product, partial [Thlaspi arvense]